MAESRWAVSALPLLWAAVLLGGAAKAAPVAGLGTWETSLHARDLDSNGTVDAFYDSALNVTWLRDSGVIGLVNWTGANVRASDLTIGGYTGWRLPTMVDTFAPPVNGPDGCNYSLAGGTDCGYNVQTKEGSTVYSELAHLFYVTLGNKSVCTPGDAACSPHQAGAGLTNTGDFLGLEAADYWLGTEYVVDTTRAWYFGLRDGAQLFGGKGSGLLALALHNGDIGEPIVNSSVPEPATGWLAALSLGGLVLQRKRFRPSPNRLATGTVRNGD